MSKKICKYTFSFLESHRLRENVIKHILLQNFRKIRNMKDIMSHLIFEMKLETILSQKKPSSKCRKNRQIYIPFLDSQSLIKYLVEFICAIVPIIRLTKLYLYGYTGYTFVEY